MAVGRTDAASRVGATGSGGTGRGTECSDSGSDSDSDSDNDSDSNRAEHSRRDVAATAAAGEFGWTRATDAAATAAADAAAPASTGERCGWR